MPEDISLAGYWAGFASPPNNEVANVSLRIRRSNQHYRGIAITRTPDGEREYIAVASDNESGGPFTDFRIVEYVSDRPYKFPPAHGLIRVDHASSDAHRLRGQYETEFAGAGTFVLYRASWPTFLYLSVPFRLRLIIAHLKAGTKRRLPAIYLILVLVLTIASTMQFVPLSLSVVDAVILFTPLLLLYSSEINALIKTLSSQVRRLGPVEFVRQSGNVARASFSSTTQALQNEFPDEFPFFSLLSGFLVTHTKALLSAFEVQASPIDRTSAIRLAENFGAPKGDVDATLQALANTGCITVDSGGWYAISDRGRRFLHFERRLQQLLTS